MKNKIKWSIGFLLSVIMLFSFFTVPTTVSASTCDTITLSGTITTGTLPIRARFTYGTDFNIVQSGQGIPTPVQTFTAYGPIQQVVTGLVANTTYFSRLELTNSVATTLSDIKSGTTTACQQPQPQPQPQPQQNPSVDISASPSSIQVGQISTLSWSSQNATSCSISQLGNVALVGNQNVFPVNTTTYTIVCTNSAGSSDSDSTTIFVNQNQPQPQPQQQPSVNISSSPSTIQAGQGSTLSWNSQNATSCFINQLGNVNLSGNQNVFPEFTTTYTITCTNFTGLSSSDSTTVFVNQQQQQPSVNISSSPSTIQAGQGSTLSWNSQNATSCFINQLGNVNLSGNRTVFPANITTYTIVCTNSSGLSASASTTVFVNQNQPQPQPQQQQPTVVVFADQVNIPFGGSVTIRWITTNASSCFASGGSTGWAGARSTGTGSFFTGSLTASRTYTLTCSNIFGSVSDSETITVRGQIIVNPTPTQPTIITPNTNVPGQVLGSETQNETALPLGANVFGTGFFPTNLFGWLLLLILVLVLVFLTKYIFDQSFSKKTTVITDQPSGKKITTTTEH